MVSSASLYTSSIAKAECFAITLIRRVPTNSQETRSPDVSPALSSSTHVFVRNCAVRKPLQLHYSGRCSVLERRPTTFVMKVNGCPDTIALDHLKPAYIEAYPTSTPPECDATLLHPSTPPP
ncbi:hypothetical protein HPB49_006197 [Dermacentor silvarum]|uniref:Uncharacterized protein n=1 Tax=Dermacentor silvarum TaxID=543639 RepID=A0ACB8CDR8_DERSI|nr:hypothetical protein HPB49_006197 [Dermacentor silvarum]